MALSLINIPNRRILDKRFVEHIIGEPVINYAISSGAKPGDNIMGRLLSMDVKTVSNDIHHVVIKSVLPMTGVIDKNTLSNSQLIAKEGTFPREIVYYKQFRPILQEALKGNEKRLSFFTSPRFFSCLHDKGKKGLNDYLVLEDLRPVGYKMVNKFKGLNYEEITETLKQLALLHAASYAVLNGTGKLRDELHAILQDSTSMTNIHGWDKRLIGGCTNHETLFNDTVAKMIELVKEGGQVELAHKIQEISKDGHSKILMDLWHKTSEQGKYFRVFIHGDLWINNILIKHCPDGKSVEDVKLIDFQMNRFGNIYEDLQYFIFTSTTADFRRANLKSSLQVYYKEFEEILQEMQCPLPPGFTEEQLISTFHETLNYGFVYNLLAIPFQLGLPPPPQPPMTPIEVKFKSTPEGNQFFSSIKIKSSNKEDSKPEQTEAPYCEPDFPEMVSSAAVEMQVSAKNSSVALKRLHEMIEEMVDFGLIN